MTSATNNHMQWRPTLTRFFFLALVLSFVITMATPTGTSAQNPPAAQSTQTAPPTQTPAPISTAAKAAQAQWPAPRPADVASIDAIVLATYDAISGENNSGPDMTRFQSLFAPDAQMIDVSYRNGAPAMNVRSIQQFVDAVKGRQGRPGRYEREVARRTEQYGNLAQVWSTNKYGQAGNATPDGYGINSISLTYDGLRWWIIAVSWKNETPGQSVPAEYMPHAAN
jgi:hypothetical protein